MFEGLKIWTNGKMIPWQDARVPLLSHGFSRGSAIFEVFGIHTLPTGVHAFRMDKHFDRLFKSAELLGMELGCSRDELAAGVIEAVQANGVKRGLVKMMAYWGEEAVISLVLDSKLDVSICAIPEFDDLGLDKTDPIDICFSKWRKTRPDMVPTAAKACANYLNGMLARRDAMERGYNLGILLNADGDVAEGSIESVFMVKDGVLKTTPLDNILASITRMSVLEICEREGIPASVEKITQAQIMAADEIFTGHTGAKVSPVKRIESRVMDSVPGPVTARIRDCFDNMLSGRDDRYRDWFQPMF